MEISFENEIMFEDEQGQDAPVLVNIEEPVVEEPEENLQPVKLLYTIKGSDYELVYTKIRVRYIEERLNRSIASIMGKISNAQEMPKLSDLYLMFAGGFKKVDGGYVSFEQGVQIAEQSIEEYGYMQLVDHILYALGRDCPFFFQ